MKSDIKAQWLTALRSGKYKQGRNHLRNGDDFCCLGVLCHLADEAGVVESLEIHRGPYQYDLRTAILPSAVQEWAGIDEANPYSGTYTDEDDPVTLSEVNDSGSTFTQIADLIEEYL